MRVKIGDTWYSSEQIPIAIELSVGEKKQIAEIPDPEEQGRGNIYAQAPMETLGWSEEDFRAWYRDQLALKPSTF